MLTVDSFVQARQDADPSRETATLRLPIVAGTAGGSHTVALGDARATHTVVSPAALSVTDLQLSRDGVPSGDAVEAVVTVRNDGGAAGTLAVKVAVDGKVAATKDVTVAGRRTPGGQRPARPSPAPDPHRDRGRAEARSSSSGRSRARATAPSWSTRSGGGDGRLTIKNGDEPSDTVVVLAAKSSPRRRCWRSTSGRTSP